MWKDTESGQRRFFARDTMGHHGERGDVRFSRSGLMTLFGTHDVQIMYGRDSVLTREMAVRVGLTELLNNATE